MDVAKLAGERIVGAFASLCSVLMDGGEGKATGGQIDVDDAAVRPFFSEAHFMRNLKEKYGVIPLMYREK